MSTDSKHVQTELSEEEYRQLREFARERGLSLKEATREALVDWVQRQQRADPTDPAFTVLDELEDESDGDAATTDARQADDLVTDWSGDDVDRSLATNPAPDSGGDDDG